MDRPISIVIPAFNQVEYCDQTLATVLRHTRRPYRLILVDNGSTDGVAELFDSVPGAHVIHAHTNLGFAGGVNLGLAAAEGHVVLLNSDTLVPEGWLARLERALTQAEDIGMVGPKSNYAASAQQIDGLTFASLDEINAFAQALASQFEGILKPTPRLVGFCLMIREDVIRRVGALDESFGLGNYEDDDYCLRVAQAGYRLCIADDCFVFHYGNRTFLGMGIVGDKWTALMEENRRRFEAKWHFEAAARSDAIQQSHRLNQKAREALERGQLTDALRLLVNAIDAYPLSEVSFNDLGVVLWEMGERSRAFDSFVHAVRINPSFAQAQENLRDTAVILDRVGEAESVLRKWMP